MAWYNFTVCATGAVSPHKVWRQYYACNSSLSMPATRCFFRYLVTLTFSSEYTNFKLFIMRMCLRITVFWNVTACSLVRGCQTRGLSVHFDGLSLTFFQLYNLDWLIVPDSLNLKLFSSHFYICRS